MYSMIPFQRREGNIFRYMDDIERSFFNNSISGTGHFRCDISEKDNEYLLQAELPGFDKDDIHVEVDGDMLTISATHNEDNSEKDEDGNYIRRERRYGTFSRSFSAEGIDVDNITASYHNGVLSLDLPKVREEVKQARKIEISAGDPGKAEPKKLSAKAKPRFAKDKEAPKAPKSPKSTQPNA